MTFERSTERNYIAHYIFMKKKDKSDKAVQEAIEEANRVMQEKYGDNWNDGSEKIPLPIPTEETDTEQGPKWHTPVGGLMFPEYNPRTWASVRPTLYTHQPMNLHEQLRTARREKGMTQQEAADLLGMKRETYNRIERGTSSTTVATMQKAGNAFGLVLTFSKAEK